MSIHSALRPFHVRAMLLYAALTIAQAAGAADKQTAVVVTVDEQKNQVTATNLTPGTQALVYGYGAAIVGYDRVFKEWHELVTDDDRDGTVTYTSGGALPWRSIWVVVDLRNAKYGVGAPNGYHVAVATDRRAFRKNATGLLDQVTSMAPWINGVYVHPGGGAWLLSASDGDATDSDSRRDGFTSVSLPSFTPISTPGERPKEFVPGGVLIIIDPFHMRLDSALLDGSVLGNGGAH